MKSLKNLFFALTFSLLLPLFLTAQHNEMGEMKNHKSQKMDHYDAPENFKNQLKGMVEAYIDLKDALVASDASQASTKAKIVDAQLKEVDGTELNDDAKQAWKKWSAEISSKLAKIHSTKSISTQRMAFSPVSDDLYRAVRSFGVKDLGAYYQFCPMAQNGKGAHWMSEDQAIRNPYYGSKMMKCGKTVEEL